MSTYSFKTSLGKGYVYYDKKEKIMILRDEAKVILSNIGSLAGWSIVGTKHGLFLKHQPFDTQLCEPTSEYFLTYVNKN